jgi:hypothetical protein
MIYVYAIVDSPRPVVMGLRGLADKSLDVQTCDGLAAVVSRDHAERPEPSPENAWRHEQVVEALMPRHAVLPARFATLFRERADLESTLGKFHDRLARGLDRVLGRVELGLRVLGTPDHVPAPATTSAPASSGREYMMARLAEDRQRRAADRLADQLHAPLARLAADSTRRLLLAPGLLLSAAYLVDRRRADEFRDAVNRLATDHPPLRLLCTGPWPPYHFVPPMIDGAEPTRD